MREHASAHHSSHEHPVHGIKDGASFQIIILGSSGGPREDNVTGMLVRAPQTEWRKGSIIAVDAGSHLASIIRILELDLPKTSDKLPTSDYSKTLKTGPFAGVRFPNISAKANGLYLYRELLHSILITHPHLDHLSGIAINTPALEYGREAKALVALPTTIEAIKNHIFNDSIWPNLSDEGNGVGFVTYRRLIEGGNPRLGYGEARGYVNVCDGLATKCWSVSHGKCHRHNHTLSHQRGDSLGLNGDGYSYSSRRLSRMSDDHGYFAAMAQQQVQNAGGYIPATQATMNTGQLTPGIPGVPSSGNPLDASHMFEPVSSSAFFIRNDETGNELLIFGDVEPDSVSMSPRNHIVWDDAAPKIANGKLKAIFIECSYDDSVRNEDLYGHLCPRHLIAELIFLANCVTNFRKRATENEQGDSQMVEEATPSTDTFDMKQPPTQAELKRKRKRIMNGDGAETPDIIPTEQQPLRSPQPIHSSYVGKRAASTSSTRRKLAHGTDQLTSPPARDTTPSRVTRQVQFQIDNPNAETANTLISDTNLNTPGHHRSVSASAALTNPHPHLSISTNNVLNTPTTNLPQFNLKEKLHEPLKGLTVHIIHVKDTLLDGPSPGEIILQQLRTMASDAGLGVEFNVTTCGQSIWV